MSKKKFHKSFENNNFDELENNRQTKKNKQMIKRNKQMIKKLISERSYDELDEVLDYV